MAGRQVMPYINRYQAMPSGVSDRVETLEKCATKLEAVKLLAEYRMSDPGGMYAISKRPTKAWLEASG